MLVTFGAVAKAADEVGSESVREERRGRGGRCGITPPHPPCASAYAPCLVWSRSEYIAENGLVFDSVSVSVSWPEFTMATSRQPPYGLFLRICGDLDRVPSSRDSYVVLQATKHLRQLLLEGFLDEVNREFRLKIRFVTRPVDEIASVVGPNVLAGMANNLLPDPEGSAGRSHLNRDKFLALEVLCVYGRSCTVCDIIDHGANSMGGVHYGDPRSDKQLAVERVGAIMSAGEMPANLMQLRSIVSVVLEALRPLRIKAERALQSPWLDTAVIDQESL